METKENNLKATIVVKSTYSAPNDNGNTRVHEYERVRVEVEADTAENLIKLIDTATSKLHTL